MPIKEDEKEKYLHSLEKFIKILNKECFETPAKEAYEIQVNRLALPYQNEKLFMSYLKAYYIEKYLNANTELEKEYLYLDILDQYINPQIVVELMDIMNYSSGASLDYINKKKLEFLKSLEVYKEYPAYEEISEKDNIVYRVAKKMNGFITMKQIKKGNYTALRDYKLDKEEISKIEFANMTEPINRVIHELYDERKKEELHCNYDAIEDETLKKFAFHTDRDNPEFEIIMDDGKIVNYFRGDIRIKPFNIAHVIYYTKLEFIKEYYDGSDITDISALISGKIDPDLDIYDMTDEEYELNLAAPFSRVYSKMYGLEPERSTITKEKSQKEIDGIKKLVKEYNL